MTRRRGFTLTEMLLAISLLSVFMLLAFPYMYCDLCVFTHQDHDGCTEHRGKKCDSCYIYSEGIQTLKSVLEDGKRTRHLLENSRAKKPCVPFVGPVWIVVSLIDVTL